MRGYRYDPVAVGVVLDDGHHRDTDVVLDFLKVVSKVVKVYFKPRAVALHSLFYLGWAELISEVIIRHGNGRYLESVKKIVKPAAPQMGHEVGKMPYLG